MTSDVTWGMFDHVSRPSTWGTLLGRITYMMELGNIPSYAELARRADINVRQLPGQIARLEEGYDLMRETVEKLAKGLKVSPGWLGFNEGWPNEAVRQLVADDEDIRATRDRPAKSTPPPPPMAQDRHRTTPLRPPAQPVKRRP